MGAWSFPIPSSFRSPKGVLEQSKACGLRPPIVMRKIISAAVRWPLMLRSGGDTGGARKGATLICVLQRLYDAKHRTSNPTVPGSNPGGRASSPRVVTLQLVLGRRELSGLVLIRPIPAASPGQIRGKGGPWSTVALSEPRHESRKARSEVLLARRCCPGRGGATMAGAHGGVDQVRSKVMRPSPQKTAVVFNRISNRVTYRLAAPSQKNYGLERSAPYPRPGDGRGFLRGRGPADWFRQAHHRVPPARGGGPRRSTTS